MRGLDLANGRPGVAARVYNRWAAGGMPSRAMSGTQRRWGASAPRSCRRSGRSRPRSPSRPEQRRSQPWASPAA